MRKNYENGDTETSFINYDVFMDDTTPPDLTLMGVFCA